MNRGWRSYFDQTPNLNGEIPSVLLLTVRPFPPCYTPRLMPRDRAEMPDGPPPFLGTWPRVYTVVLVYLAALIVVFYAFTRYFS